MVRVFRRVGRHRSVYPSQILAFKKAKFIGVETGKEIEGVKVKIEEWEDSWIPRIFKSIKGIKNNFTNKKDKRKGGSIKKERSL